jgi:alpha-ketoglutarate-dependent taurine dioxygenase
MELVFDIVGAHAEPYAALPTLTLQLRIAETTGAHVHAVVLKGQIRIEPQRRRYTEAEQARLLDLFGEPHQWSESLHPFLWTHIAVAVPGFEGSTEVELPITCSYDFEIAAAKYFHGLENGEIPLVILFSGTAFVQSDQGVVASPVPWHKESQYRLPVSVWQSVVDLHFPNSGWLRVSRETLDALQAYKSRRALPTWDQAFELMLKEAGEE